MAIGSWTSRVINSGADKTQGRGSWFYVQFGDSRVIRITSVYKVNKVKIAEDTCSSFAQQYALQINAGIPAPRPWVQVIVDLTNFVEE